MHRMVLVLGAIYVMCAGSGCAAATGPITLDATPSEREALAGEWRGGYTAAAYDRHGTIAFTIGATDGHVSGSVLMWSGRLDWSYLWDSPSTEPTSRPMGSRQALGIRFVRTDHGMISGTTDPYWDPHRRCHASASFLGSVETNVISGTFVSVCDDGLRMLDGRWRVARQRPSSDR